jgi:RNase P subunit RPR2
MEGGLTMGNCCDRCGAALVPGDRTIVLTMEHHGHDGPERDVRRRLCKDCAEALVAYLQRRPEVLDANRLVTVTR